MAFNRGVHGFPDRSVSELRRPCLRVALAFLLDILIPLSTFRRLLLRKIKDDPNGNVHAAVPLMLKMETHMSDVRPDGYGIPQGNIGAATDPGRHCLFSRPVEFRYPNPNPAVPYGMIWSFFRNDAFNPNVFV